ncbi:LAQU0S01e00914g1_1 [Lachancea quebecensis]|uniref:LAQU0S01e00914g1_1 n=1 Tax=Lachancea quebecensis TaxID=1654605 RepID=A0A0P1KUM8_9SACH|nr:LAQU0S01e00914g1_1 [Lachancea quebecensis]
MLEEQLYVLLCCLSVKRDVSAVQKLITGRNCLSLSEVLGAICVLWPELAKPTEFRKILEFASQDKHDDTELPESLIKADAELISIVEMEPDALRKRRDLLRTLVDSRLQKLNSNISDSDWHLTFLKARVRVCNLVVTDTLFYKPLWTQLTGNEYESFHQWVSGILKPLAHYNKRCSTSVSVTEFEDLSHCKILGLFWDSLEGHFKQSGIGGLPASRAVLTYEILPFVKYTSCYQDFLTVIFNQKVFSFDTLLNYNLFKTIALETPTTLPSHFSKTFKERALLILYENAYKLEGLGLESSSEHLEILGSMKGDISLFNEIDLRTLRFYSENMDTLHISNFRDIHKLASDTELAQRSYFSLMCKSMLQSDSSGALLKKIAYFMHGDLIFSKLSSEEKEFIVVESLLGSGNFDALQEFMADSKTAIEDSVLLRFFWSFFNNAPSGSHKTREMLNARKVLTLLPKNQYAHLSDLLDVVDYLSKFSPYFSKGVPFKPSILLEFKTEPFDVISKLLELNPQLCRNLDEVFKILKKLYSGLEIPDISPDFYDEFTRLLVLHIDFALANFDFEFAYQKTKLLLTRRNSQVFWSTVLQVGKFFDPSWPDSEIPTEIIYLQLEILGNLLHICPEDEIEAVVTQWSGLELELSTRDLVTDQYSLANERSENAFKRQMLEEVSGSVSNFFSSGLKWATGDN